MTWNLFLTLVLVPLSTTVLGIWISKKAETYYKGWEQYNKLRDDQETKFKQETDRNHKELAEVVHRLEQEKADRMELHSEKERLWRHVVNHYHEIDCASPECDARRTGEKAIPSFD